MKARSLFSFGMSLVLWGAGVLPVFAQIDRQYQTKQSRNILQNLPDGDYFYRQSTSVNGFLMHLIFRKTGNIVTGEQYDNPSAGPCFQGKINQNSINNITIGYLNEEFDLESGYHFVPDPNPINLGSYYRLRLDQIPEGLRGELQRCLQAFPKK